MITVNHAAAGTYAVACMSAVFVEGTYDIVSLVSDPVELPKNTASFSVFTIAILAQKFSVESGEGMPFNFIAKDFTIAPEGVKRSNHWLAKKSAYAPLLVPSPAL